jgi:uncharacterized membrane protein
LRRFTSSSHGRLSESKYWRSAVIVAGVVIVGVQRGMVRYLFELGKEGAYESYKHQLGKPLLLGLDLLVAADLIRVVALEATIINVGVLGLLVLVRTFMSWSLSVEVQGRWPWQARVRSDAGIVPGKGE